MSQKIEILKRPEAIKMLGIGDTMLNEKLNPKSKYHDPSFPKPIALGGRSVGFYRHELEAWLASRPRVTPEEREKRAKPLVEGRRSKRKAAPAHGAAA